jgi:hypothetical protein
MLYASRPLRQNEITNFGGTVPDADFDIIRKLHSEFTKHAARVNYRTRTIGSGLVPNWRKSEDGPWVARAESTNDHVVHFGGILNDDHVLALHASVTELADGGVRVGE